MIDLYQALQDRRSIRKYKPDPVPADKLERILEAARIAPSWSNQQCWRFIVVEDKTIRQALAESMPDNNPARKAVGETAPLVLVLCADPKESGNQDQKEYYLLDAGLAMQQLMLAAHAEGLGTCWVAWFDEEKARAACAVPQNYRVVALSPLGFPNAAPSVRPRKELDQITFRDRWGTSLWIK